MFSASWLVGTKGTDAPDKRRRCAKPDPVIWGFQNWFSEEGGSLDMWARKAS